MKKKKEKGMLALSCLINCSTSNNELCEIMDLIENKFGSSLNLWKEYSKVGNTRKQALKDFKNFLKI